MLLTVVKVLEVACVKVRVSGQLTEDVQETVCHHGQARISVDEHLHAERQGKVRPDKEIK